MKIAVSVILEESVPPYSRRTTKDLRVGAKEVITLYESPSWTADRDGTQFSLLRGADVIGMTDSSPVSWHGVNSGWNPGMGWRLDSRVKPENDNN